MEEIEKDSYYRLHQKIALVSLLTKQMKKQQQQPPPQKQSFSPSSAKKFLGIFFFITFISLQIIHLGTFSCDSLSCVSSNVQSKKKHRNVNNNNNNNNNTATQTTDEQNHLLEFYIYDVTHERNLNLTVDANDKRLIIFYNISNGLYSIGIRNGKFVLDFIRIVNQNNSIRNKSLLFFLSIH